MIEFVLPLVDDDDDGPTGRCGFAHCHQPIADLELARQLGLCLEHAAYAQKILSEPRRARVDRRLSPRRETAAAFRQRRRQQRERREQESAMNEMTGRQLVASWWSA